MHVPVSSTEPSPASPATRSWAPLVLLCAIGGIVVLDYSIVFVAVPSIVDDLGFSAAATPWIANAYALTFGALLLLGGRLGDVLGRRRVLTAGLVLFTVSSAACGLADGAAVLLGARVVQGVGAALLAPAALSLITTIYHGEPARGRAIAVYGAVAGAAGAFGTVVGGLLTQLASWHWAFLINLPLGVVALAVTPRLLPAGGARPGGLRTLDVPGAVLATSGLFALVLGVSQADHHGFASETACLLFAAAAALLAGFVAVERRAAHPLLRLSLFRLRGVSVGNGAYLIAGAATFGALFLLSLYFQQVLGYDPVRAGAAVVPLAAGMFALSGLSAEGDYLREVLPGSLLTAAGLGLVIVPITALATGGVPAEDAGLASGLFSTAQELGGVLGLAVLTTIANGRAAASGAGDAATAQVEGLQLAFQIAGGAALVALALAAALLPRRPSGRGGWRSRSAGSRGP